MPNAIPKATIRGSSVEIQANKTVSISENAASIPVSIREKRPTYSTENASERSKYLEYFPAFCGFLLRERSSIASL